MLRLLDTSLRRLPDMTIRPLRQIFEHLRKLCHQPGFLHAISWILYRDFYVSMDDQGKITLAGQQDRYARSRLNNNEFMLLAGLLAQSDTLDVFLESGETDLLVATADRLLEELHTRMEAPMREALQNPDALRLSQYNFGDVAREAIYYGAESAFTFQYRNFARDRYRPDYEWLLKHKGISVRPMIDIAQSIVYFTSLQVNVSLDSYRNQDANPNSL